MNIPDHFPRDLETVLGLKILKFFYADPNPESGIEKFGSGIRDKHPGSATWLSLIISWAQKFEIRHNHSLIRVLDLHSFVRIVSQASVFSEKKILLFADFIHSSTQDLRVL
jgi:hypothetical protein